MKPIKKVDVKVDTTECILRLGKGNNAILREEDLKSVIRALYGSTANFLQTNEIISFPRQGGDESFIRL